MITKHRYDLQGDNSFEGLSSDTKPTEDVPINSLFLEMDTYTFFYWDGSAWKEIGGE